MQLRSYMFCRFASGRSATIAAERPHAKLQRTPLELMLTRFLGHRGSDTPAPGEGDALRTTLPLRRPERFPAGRGYIVNSTVPTMAQVALPPTDALADERIEDTQAAIDRSPPESDSTAPAPLPTSPDGRYVIDLGLDGGSA